MELKLYTKSELLDYCLSAEYSSARDVSISQHRATSYLQNPRGDYDDIVMIHAYDGEILAGYLGILPDHIVESPSEDLDLVKQKFGWLSCIWVHSEYLGKGIAKSLLAKMAEEWNGKILATEFIPGLQKLYLQSGYFKSGFQIPGLRIYFGSTMGDWIPRKFPAFNFTKPLLIFCDRLLNQIWTFRKKDEIISNNWETSNLDDIRLKEFIHQHHQQNPFRRNVDEFKWMCQYPWVLEKSDAVICDKRYYFTSCVEKFSVENFVLKNSNEEIQIFVQLLRKNFCLTVNYLFIKDTRMIPELYALIHDFILRNKIAVLRVFGNQNLRLFDRRLDGEIIRRKVVREFLLSESMQQYIKGDVDEIQAGDGDCGFT